jgi:pyruvate/2-oxoglutarate dehydrogenase complex dihydrolipoamide acyltransferase (E2) component
MQRQTMTSTDYLLPQLPFGGAPITIVRWLKRVGDAVSVGEPLVVVVNDCVEVALPAIGAGILERILAAEGAAVAAGVAVATIAAHTAAHISDVPDAARAIVRISPVARRIADLEGIGITELQSTGISGWITKADVLAALVTQSPDAPSPGEREGRAYDGASPRHPVTPSRVTPHTPLIPQLPTPSSQLLAHDTYILTAIDLDLERVASVIAQHGPSFARRRLELSYIVCVALAAAAALPYHRLLNSYWADMMIVTQRRVHLAVVPCDSAPIRCVHDAQDLNLRGLARGLGGAATEHTIGDSTFTIVDLGDHTWGDPAAWASGVGILTKGRAAALGIGAVRARPLVIDDGGVDRLAVRQAALLTLAYDARVLDQCYADAFLRDVKSRLERFMLRQAP